MDERLSTDIVDEKLKKIFSEGRTEGLLDDEIFERFFTKSMEDGFYLKGHEHLWNSEESFQLYCKDRAIKLNLTLLKIEEMVQIIKRYVDIPDQEIVIGILFSIHTGLRGWLPSDLCAYLHFIGQSQTGKSHAGQLFCEISGMPWLQNVSEGALLSGLEEADRGIGIDEVDSNLKRIEALEGVLRTGCTWDACYRKMVQDPETKNMIPKNLPCGGPKVLTSIGPLEEALESRCYVIEMETSARKLELSRNWIYRHDDVERLAKSIKGYQTLAKMRKKPNELKEWHFSPEYMAELHKLEACGGRRADLAHIFLTVAWSIGLSLPTIVESLTKETVDDEKEWLRTILLEIYEDAMKSGMLDNDSDLKATRLFEFVNEKRRHAGLRPWTQRAFGIKMTELGFTDKGPKRRKADGWYYRFDEHSLKLLQKGTPRQTVLTDLSGLIPEETKKEKVECETQPGH